MQLLINWQDWRSYVARLLLILKHFILNNNRYQNGNLIVIFKWFAQRVHYFYDHIIDMHILSKIRCKFSLGFSHTMYWIVQKKKNFSLHIIVIRIYQGIKTHFSWMICDEVDEFLINKYSFTWKVRFRRVGCYHYFCR